MTIENVAFAQNTIYAAAEPVVEVLLGALSDERPHWTRIWIIEMLRFILVAGSPDDPHLLDRCVERTRLAFWLLVEHARRDSDLDREAVLEVLGLVDADRARLVRAALR